MLKFIRKYKQILLVVAGILLMIAFLLPQALDQFINRQNVTVMKIDGRKVKAIEYDQRVREFEFLNRIASRTLPMMGITGPEQWILLNEVALRAGYVGDAGSGGGAIDDIGRVSGLLILQAQQPQLFSMLMNSPQSLEMYLQPRVEQTRASVPGAMRETRLSENQVELALAKFKGVQRLIDSYKNIARVSTVRAIQRAERQLEGAQVDYVFVSAERKLPEVAEPDDAALQAFMEKYKDVRHGDGEYGIGYLLPPRIKIEYMVVDAKKISERVQPDLRELRRRYNAMTDKTQTFEDARPALEAQVRSEMSERVVGAINEAVRTRVSLATRRLSDDRQFKVLPEDWATSQPRLGAMTADIVKHVQEKTGVRIDPPEVVVKDGAFLTFTDLNELPGIGTSAVQRGQRSVSFANYVLSVREIAKDTPLTLQVGIPSDEVSRNNAGQTFYFTVLDTRPESAPRSIDEVRERLTADWKKVEGYKLLIAQEAEAMKAKAMAEGLASLDTAPKVTIDVGNAPPVSDIKTARVTRNFVSNGDENVNTDIFRQAVIDAAEKLDPLVSADTYTPEQRTLLVQLPQQLGVVVAQIKQVSPLTLEDFRGQQNGVARTLQQEEIRELKSAPFSVERLRERLNVEYPTDRARENAETSEG